MRRAARRFASGGVEGADGFGDVGGFGFGEFEECTKLRVDVAGEIKQTISRLPFFKPRHFLCKRG